MSTQQDCDSGSTRYRLGRSSRRSSRYAARHRTQKVRRPEVALPISQTILYTNRQVEDDVLVRSDCVVPVGAVARFDHVCECRPSHDGATATIVFIVIEIRSIDSQLTSL